jgi:hypothetical protein
MALKNRIMAFLRKHGIFLEDPGLKTHWWTGRQEVLPGDKRLSKRAQEHLRFLNKVKLQNGSRT